MTLVALLGTAQTARAGKISLAWDPVPDADLATYRVYVGTNTSMNDVAVLDVGTVTAVEVDNLPDCLSLNIGVKAVDFAGNESPSFSNVVTGLTQPVVSSVSPTMLPQRSENELVTVSGTSFTPDMDRTDIVFDNPEVRVLDLQWLSCTRVEVSVAVGPFVLDPGDAGYNGDGTSVEVVDPAEEGSYPVLATAPDPFGNRIAGAPSCTPENPASCPDRVLEVEWLAQRSDTDGSGRVDGYDLARLSRAAGSSRCTPEAAAAGDCNPDAEPAYDPGVDMNGDKIVDGVDLAFFSSVFGEVF